MCAVPMLGLAVGLMQSGAQFAAQSADYAAKSEQWKQNYVNSLAAGRDEQKQLQLRSMQEEEAKNQKVQLANIEEAQKKSEAELSASEAGVGGLSIQSVLVDMGRRASFNRQTEERNWNMTAMQLAEEMKSTNTKIQQRINSVERPTAPSPFGMIANVAGAALRMA